MQTRRAKLRRGHPIFSEELSMKRFYAFVLPLFVLNAFGANAAAIDGLYAYVETSGSAALVRIDGCEVKVLENWTEKNRISPVALECSGSQVSTGGRPVIVDSAGNLRGSEFTAIRAQDVEPFGIEIGLLGKETHSFDRDCDAVVISKPSLFGKKYYTTSSLVCGYLNAEKSPVAVYRRSDESGFCIAKLDGAKTQIDCM
jgi:hypothetical protein